MTCGRNLRLWWGSAPMPTWKVHEGAGSAGGGPVACRPPATARKPVRPALPPKPIALTVHSLSCRRGHAEQVCQGFRVARCLDLDVVVEVDVHVTRAAVVP